MEEQEENRIIIETEKCSFNRTLGEYIVNKKIKTESDIDIGCINLKIEHELDLEAKQNKGIDLISHVESFRDTEDTFLTSNINSPKSLCEVSLEEKYYRCPYCSFETNIKKYMKIHLASETHLFLDYESISAKKFTDFEPEAELQNSDYRMTPSKFFSSDPLCEAYLEDKFYRCPHCPYGTNIKKCFKMHIANEVHLITKSSKTASENIFDRYKRACGEILMAKSIDYDLEMLPPQRVIPHIILCKICGYEATSTRALSKHTEIEHRPLLKCSETIYKISSPHKRPRSRLDLAEGNNSRSKYSRIEKLVCDVCAYQAKDGIDLKVHKLKHRDVSELLKHKCTYCDGNGRKSCQIRKNKYTRGRVECVD